MSVQHKVIAGTYLEVLFDLVTDIYKSRGHWVTDWRGWPELNGYYPCHLPGNYIKTDENNAIECFISHEGKGGLHAGYIDEIAFEEVRKVLDLKLVEDRDGYNSLTYKGKRDRYWKINNPKFAGDPCTKESLPQSSEIERLSNVVDLLKSISKEGGL
jgi:hypothetical protein